MILVADSGGSKTDWRLLDGDLVEQFKTPGMNPYLVDSDSLVGIMRDLASEMGPRKVDEIHFYGAGCSTEENNLKIYKAIHSVYKNSSITVSHDLLAAARALCGNEPGIACILGTGANSCLYDGKEIIENVPSLGYVLGDEGGGTYLGKTLVSNYFNQTLPEDLSRELERRYDMSRNTVLENVYQKQGSAHYLAGFSKFLFDHRKNPFVDNLLRDSFKLFFERNVLRYNGAKQLPVHFCGSVAFYYNNVIRQTAVEFEITVKNIVEGPIAGLTLFHQRQSGDAT